MIAAKKAGFALQQTWLTTEIVGSVIVVSCGLPEQIQGALCC